MPGMQPIAPPPLSVVQQLSDLIAIFGNLDQAKALVKELKEATVQQQEALKARGLLDKLDEFTSAETTKIEAMRKEAEQELSALKAQRAELEVLRQEAEGKRSNAESAMNEAQALKAEAEALKAEALSKYQNLLAQLQAPLTGATS